MSGPIERAAAALQSAMRELIPEDLARLKAEHEATHASGGFLMPDRLAYPVPDNLAGVIQDESVEVAIAALPSIATQEAFNAYILGLIEGLSAGAAAAAPNYLYWTPDTSATDPEWLTYDGTLLRWEEP